MKRLASLCVCAIAAVAVTPATAKDVEPGLWEITMESHVPSDAGWAPAPFSLTQCLTEHDAQDPSRIVGSISAPGATDCRYMDKSYSGGTFRFAMTCGGSFGIIAKGSISFGSDNFSGDITATANTSDGHETEFHNRVVARRLGSCGK
jgi:hypothetical protein